MSTGAAETISIFRYQIESRRFDDSALRNLEALLVSKDVKLLLEVRSSLMEFLRSQSLPILREIAAKPVRDKLRILDFLVRAFALSGDVESCLALRYEALVLRELKSATNQWLQVSYREWLTFAEHSLENGFYAVARKACENALLCFQTNFMVCPETESSNDVHVIDQIKRLRDFAVVSAASRSVQAQAAGYLEKKTTDHSTKTLKCEEVPCLASTLFRNGIKKHNIRKLQEHQNMQRK